MIVYETECYLVERQGERLVGREKPHRVLAPDAKVFVQAIEGDVRTAVRASLDAIGVEKIIHPGDRVAVKVNIGGGITGVPSSYTEPEIVAGVLESFQALGAQPFVCEADMRVLTMDERMLRRRGYRDMLDELGVEFINLSYGDTVDFFLHDLDRPLLLPALLLDPEMKIVSVPSPKHHWECGVTLAQKNMYGAIAERRKSLYHFHGQSILDRVVAGAARIMRPCLCVIGATQFCGGLGPHLCVPIEFNRIIVGNDMLAADAVAAGFLNFPYDRVRHARINLGDDELRYELLPGSADLPEETRAKIEKHRVRPQHTKRWRRILLAQYYIPHRWQYKYIAPLEPIATWINKTFYAPRGDKSEI
ncbi:MAG: DUF362 domain-containing protein [Alphaproteobacteria bacterium]